VVVGGDFNLIRGAQDKSNTNINWPRVHLFNNYIARLALRELKCSGARFTWTNNQANPMGHRQCVYLPRLGESLSNGLAGETDTSQMYL
jgi:hypothetical protein